jgi:hypothetical protein
MEMHLFVGVFDAMKGVQNRRHTRFFLFKVVKIDIQPPTRILKSH